MKPWFSQMIVSISDSDIEGNASKELLEIGRDVLLRTPMLQKFGHVEITCSFALILSQHGHRGYIEPTPIADAVEALHAEGAEFAAKSLSPDRRYGWRAVQGSNLRPTD